MLPCDGSWALDMPALQRSSSSSSSVAPPCEKSAAKEAVQAGPLPWKGCILGVLRPVAKVIVPVSTHVLRQHFSGS